MTRLLPILALFLLIGCDTKTSYPLQICSQWEEEACSGGFQCVGFRCIQECTYEGDCDLGFRCVNGSCLQSCEASDDCTIGECDPVGDSRPGSACTLRNLPDCATDDHCGWGICDDGACLGRCDWVGSCGLGQFCDFRRGEFGACIDDPDYEPPPPPPPPSSCAEAPSPDNWCRTETGYNAYCDGQTCRRRYVALIVFDETLPSVCDDDDPAPGTDLLGVRIVSANGTYVTILGFGSGSGNEYTDYAAVETADEPVCDASWMSLGCGGGIAFIGGDGPMYPGDVVEVYTRQGWCAENDTSFANVYLCDEYPADLDTARTLCDVYLGPADDTYLYVPDR